MGTNQASQYGAHAWGWCLWIWCRPSFFKIFSSVCDPFLKSKKSSNCVDFEETQLENEGDKIAELTIVVVIWLAGCCW